MCTVVSVLTYRRTKSYSIQCVCEVLYMQGRLRTTDTDSGHKLRNHSLAVTWCGLLDLCHRDVIREADGVAMTTSENFADARDV